MVSRHTDVCPTESDPPKDNTLTFAPTKIQFLLVKDNRTLFAAMRVDGGDGVPSHRTLPFLSSTSTDNGHTWSPVKPLPSDMLSSQPKMAVLGNGALLMTAGRPGLDLWVSADGFGQSWEMHSLPTKHNTLVGAEGHPAEWKYVRMSCWRAGPRRPHPTASLRVCLIV